jgi:hypothetical protein
MQNSDNQIKTPVRGNLRTQEDTNPDRVQMLLFISLASLFSGLVFGFVDSLYTVLLPISIFALIPIWSIVTRGKHGKISVKRILIWLFLSFAVIPLTLFYLLFSWCMDTFPLEISFLDRSSEQYSDSYRLLGAGIVSLVTALIGFIMYGLTYAVPRHIGSLKTDVENKRPE